MINSYTTGGYIDSWCTKCKLELGHTIVAMVDNGPKKVKCNTCNGEHNYRSIKRSEPRQLKAKVIRKAKGQESHYDEYIARLTGGDFSNARKYSMSENFKKGEMLDHPKFGSGIVLAVIQDNKIEILFKDGPKLLIHNRESAASLVF